MSRIPLVRTACSLFVVLLSACSDSPSGSGGTDGGTGSDASTNGDSGGSASGEPAMLAGITAAHNVVRANVSPAPTSPLVALIWSDTIASAAQTWANGCNWSHSSNAYGENIYAVTGGTVTGQAVVDDWASESVDYDYATNSCSNVCGHYTQVVWADTTQVGCGVKVCTTNSPFPAKYGPTWTFVVCDYDPPGNVGNQSPY